MAIKRPKPAEIVVKLWQVDVLIGQGMPRIGAVRQVSVGPPLKDCLLASPLVADAQLHKTRISSSNSSIVSPSIGAVCSRLLGHHGADTNRT